MIVKNEAHIIHESMKCTLPLIDTFCIVDTGSTDDTIQKIKDFYKENNIEGEVHERPWKNFGHNRSEALQLCDDKMDYIIVIDADDLMGFPTNGKELLHSILEKENPNGATIDIRQGKLNYHRGQIFKANDSWKYVGVLHEYPSNGKPQSKMIHLPPEFWMESRRLGARNLVGDKAKRDIAVLEQGLIDEPENERYMFYLGQSYFEIGDFNNSKKWYKKRFHIGKWYEEAWFSAYRVGMCHLFMGNIPKFEEWSQRAYAFHKHRAEPIYELTKYFREKANFYKAYHYMQIGRTITYPKKDVLFIDSFHHQGAFDYEASILDYYIHPDKKIGMRSSITYLLKQDVHVQNVVGNMEFYATPISDHTALLDIPKLFGEDFRPSAVSVLDYPFANIRYVNYLKPTDGSYRTKDGSPIQTHNAYVNLNTGECIAEMDDSTVELPDKETQVKGLEDIRLFNQNGIMKFVATNYRQYSSNIGIVVGDYDYKNKAYKNCKPIKSPLNQECEKNWMPVSNKDVFIYNWSPLTIGKIVDDELKIVIKHDTPTLFSLFRGSAPPIVVNDKLMVLVHFVKYGSTRIYYHAFVELDIKSYKPIRVTLPFVFKDKTVEYCVSFRIVDALVECFASILDSDPFKIIFPLKDLEWTDVYIDK
jgi:glycosyltransferase involved in cell wall biosynthesis